MKYNARTLKYKKFFINSGLKIYNSIPWDFRQKGSNIFNKLTKNWIITYKSGVTDTGD